MLNKMELDSDIARGKIRLQKRKKANLANYFGAIKDEDLLRGLEEDSRKIRGSGLQKPRF